MEDGPSLMDDREATSLRLELRRIPRTPIRALQAEALVKVRGFVAVDGPAIPAPVTGVPCAIYAVDAKLVRRDSEWRPWQEGEREPASPQEQSPLPRETGGRDLILDDGTGRALVRIARAQLSLLGNWRISLAATRAPFLVTRSNWADHHWANKHHLIELEYRELIVVPGEILTVFGRAIYEADPEPPASGPHPYRSARVRCAFVGDPSSPLYIVQERVVALDAVG
jgi:hypothetical protein